MCGTELWRIIEGTPQIERVKDPLPTSRFRYIRVRGTQAAGYVVPRLVERGRLRNGQEVLIVPLPSGGSGGVFYALLYTRLGSALRFVGYIPARSGHLQLSIRNGELVATTPVYGAMDPNCCPSRHRSEFYTLRGLHLQPIRSTVQR